MKEKKKRKVGKECNLIDNMFASLFVVVAVIGIRRIPLRNFFNP